MDYLLWLLPLDSSQRCYGQTDWHYYMYMYISSPQLPLQGEKDPRTLDARTTQCQDVMTLNSVVNSENLRPKLKYCSFALSRPTFFIASR